MEIEHMVSGTILTILIFMVSQTNTCGPGVSPGPRSSNLEVRKRQPDVPEDTDAASGKFEQALLKNDSRLKRISSTQIVFAGKDFNAKCRLTTKQCKESLLRLADVVDTHWSKQYKLEVIVGFIEQEDIKNVFKRSSLHLEGRAFDLKLIEAPGKRLIRRSTNRIALTLPTLAGLAYYEAEFSFVEVKEHHIHVSCPKKEKKKSGGILTRFSHSFSRCFPEDAHVRREDGHQILMKDLKTGDKVLTLNQQGAPIYSEVSMIMHRQSNVTVEDYAKISTEKGKTITLSLHHLIPVSKVNSTEQVFIFSKDVRPYQHHIFVYDEHGGTTSRSLVISVEHVVKRGAYAPLTMEGTIVVNDIYASCYALFPSHLISHYVFMAWRTIYTFVSPIIGLTNDSEGYHWYPNLFRIGLNMLPILPYEM